jgi:hypothetical protein
VVGENGKKTIEPDPALAPVVRQMFERYATGQHSLEGRSSDGGISPTV